MRVKTENLMVQNMIRGPITNMRGLNRTTQAKIHPGPLEKQ